jgi:hypothetical protein
MAAMSRRPVEILSRSLARDMKRASDDVPDDWSPLLGSTAGLRQERPFRSSAMIANANWIPNRGRSLATSPINCHAAFLLRPQKRFTEA